MSQQKRILNYLKQGKELTRLNSWKELNVLEAPARISELRAEGHHIHTEMITIRNKYGEKVRIAKWTLKGRG